MRKFLTVLVVLLMVGTLAAILANITSGSGSTVRFSSLLGARHRTGADQKHPAIAGLMSVSIS